MKLSRLSALVVTLLAVALIVAACGAETTGEGSSTTSPPTTTRDITTTTAPHHDHMHGTIEWSGSPTPAVSVDVVADSSSGWNVFAEVTGFEFAPENASTDHVEGEGHAHVEVDGEKIARVYGTGFHIPELPPGEHEIRYVLAANNHDVYVNEGEPLAASMAVTVPEPDEDESHSHGHDQRSWDGDEAASVSVVVEKDPKAGWNLITEVTGFELTPTAVGGEHVPGEGHAHIYVNGQKLARVYNDAFHIEELPAGDLTIEYRLSGNDHVEYDVGGSVLITVSEEDGSGMDMGGDAIVEIVVEGGEPVGGPMLMQVSLGGHVHFRVISDKSDHVHVHGYDLFYDVGPNMPAEVMFTADVPGVFEVELEGSHTLIVELVVSS